MAEMWLEKFSKDFGDKMPHSEKINLPSSMTRGDVFDRMKLGMTEIGVKPCSMSCFLKMWRKEFIKKNIVIPKVR